MSRYAVYVLALMVAINGLNYMDRWVGSAVAPLIQAEFDLSDFSLGLLGSAFTLVYTLAVLPFGLWADRGTRRAVIGTGVAVWSAATLLTGLTANFAQLFATRAVLGVGEASYFPAGTSLLGDYFPRHLRGRAIAIWSCGSAVGIALGFAGGGLLATRVGWRPVFFASAVPGLLLAALAFRLREPLRGSAEEHGPRLESARDATLRGLLALLGISSLRWTILSQTALFVVLGANAYWLPSMLIRRFGMSLAPDAAPRAGIHGRSRMPHSAPGWRLGSEMTAACPPRPAAPRAFCPPGSPRQPDATSRREARPDLRPTARAAARA